MVITPKRKTALIAFLAFDVLIVAALFSLFQMRAERQTESELRDIGVTIYPEALPLSDFTLRDQRGEPFTRGDFEGQWNLVFFGFTNCPDICPLTMAELRQFYAALDFTKDVKPRVFLVTVDPQRDNPETMAAYLNNYNTEFIGLSGDPQAISRLASQLYVVYEDTAESEASNSHDHASPEIGNDVQGADDNVMNHDDYLITHSGHIAVIDPEGNYYAVMRAPHRDRDLLTAFRELVR